ncbi:MAG: hypothetical protein DRJ49_01430 [Thermoprotei archaeon]|nr:MAG: hypothetical protein DRJ49_01430 [Thermoprotei archaeon]
MKFKPTRYLKPKEFDKYLKTIRRIADFNPLEKVWILNTRKLLKNIDHERELIRLLDELAKYIPISEDEVRKILNTYREKSRTIVLDKDLTFKVRINLSRSTFRELVKLCEYSRGKFRLRNPRYVHEVEELLHKEGLSLKYDKDILRRAIAEASICSITRKGGYIRVKFKYFDQKVWEKLRDELTLSYYVEKPVFDEDGNLKDIEYIERRIKAYAEDLKDLCIETAVGLLDRVIEVLEREGYSVDIDIMELPTLDVPMEQRFKLYPYQEAAYREWLKRKRGTIAIFTRGGKSFIAMKAIIDLKKPTVIFVTTRELAQTWRGYIERYLGIPSPLIGYLGEGIRKITPITIAIYNSAVKYIELIKDKFELSIFDECHHVPARTFKEVALKISALYRMGLSATPKRRDRNEILLYALAGELLINIDYAQLLALKVVAPIETFRTYFVEGTEEKISTLLDIVKKHKESKIIVYTQLLKSADELYRQLRDRGFRVALITGRTAENRRKRAFKDFMKGAVNIIVTTTVLDEGITVPDADIAIIYEGTGEPRQMIQRIGRVLGFLPGKTAKVYELVDVTNKKELRAHFRRKWVKELYTIPPQGFRIDSFFQ